SASATTQAALSHSCGTPVNVPQDAPSIQAGLNAACSGDTVYVSAGTYRENITVPRSQLTLKGASGTTPEQVIIDGGGIADVVYAKAVSDFVIDGFTLQNASQGGSMPGGGGLFINGNVCCSFNAGNTIARNLIVKSNSHGVVVWNVHAGSISLERNLIVGNLYSGIDASSPISSGQMIITNNTIAKNSRDGYYDWAGGGSRTFRNNIIVSNGRYGVYSNQYTTKYASYDDVWGNTQRDYCNAEPYGSCITSYTPSPGTGELSADPKFVSSSDYHLQSTSPAINAGDPGSQYNDPNGTRNDMGAYPFVGSTATTTAADTAAPSAPNVSYIIHSTQVDLSWAPSTDNVGVAGYRINRGGSLLVTLATTTTGATISYYDAGLSPSTTYSYVVTAYDAAGNVSLPNSANITTLGGTTADTTPPSVPTNLLAVASSSSQINLSWTASTDNVGVAGYKIYRGSLLLASWSGTSYSDVGTFPSLSPSTSYTYTVAAYDAAGNVSSQSSPASATTPAALLAPTAVSSEFGSGWPGRYEQSIRFGYPSSGISQVSSFRFYEKKPNDAAFNLVETFANVAPLVTNCSGPIYGNAWNLSYACSAGFWDAHSKSTHTSSFFQVGEYDYYVTAVDSSDAESAPSPTLKEYILQPVEITSPTSAQSPTAPTPTIRWNAVSGWPSSFTPPYYIQVSEEGALTSYMSPVYTASVSVTSGSTTGSKVYAGPALDPAKKYIVEIYGSTTSQGASYMAMVKDLQTFWVASSTASGASGSSLADLLESLRSLVAALQKLQSSAR
ncbi:MAG: right-handed parallel beta-helix repeat-containing protein, partial [Candidatus Liptonbacteria bacterium]|nr:right-handed parallel beta-helix repeat-containing protein [Candidatus Liptonbacteria bacterium]